MMLQSSTHTRAKSIMVPGEEVNTDSIATNGIYRPAGYFMSNAVICINFDYFLITYSSSAVC